MVGYTGGKESNPSYKSVFDATEAILIEYDPTILSFETLLHESSKQHNPYINVKKRQYRSVVWFQNENQRKATNAHVEQLKRTQHGFGKTNLPRKVYIDIETVTPFYRAEEYHQDYIEKHWGIFD